MKEKWVLTAKRADFDAIGKQFHIDPVTARIIRNRDVEGEAAIEKYLHGTVEDLYSPWDMKDMEKAVQILEEKIRDKKPIRIIGDYDIDGVCATYILRQGFRLLEGNADYEIPDRIKDGYGINHSLIEQAYADGIDTIVTCDNGISAREEIAYAKEKGMTVVVTDHHEVPYVKEEGAIQYLIPQADAVVNPKQKDCPYPFKGLCGAAVAYKLIEALYTRQQLPKDELYKLLKFAAIATIGDVMDLQDENRILVKYGLERIHRTTHPGLLALFQVNQLSPKDINAYHIGFVIGPCLNASGRLDSAKRALQLLETREPVAALSFAEDLKALNDSRKTLTEQAVMKAKQLIEETSLKTDKVLVVFLPDCHESIAGIIAGRLRETYHKPVFVITRAEQGLKGSGRSIEAYSMFDKLQECKDLLLHFGGHPMAAGLSLEEENLPKLQKRLNEECGLTEEDFVEKIVIDVPMPMDYITEKLVEEFALLEPYGKGNTKPVFAEKNLTVCGAELVGKKKNVLKLILENSRGKRMNGICFFQAQEMYAYVQTHKTIMAVYYPQIEEFRGRKSLQVVISHYQ